MLPLGTPADGCAPRGEGYLAVELGVTGGLGATSSGGGGASGIESGGGGGANAGAGGRGAHGHGSTPRGGLGGLPANADASRRLLFGGGGGGGGGAEIASSRGGAGGGIVYLRARSLAGGGRVTASGLPGEDVLVDQGGAGGGAGGTVALLLEAGAAGLTVAAEGGAGGDQDEQGSCNGTQGGPGGGGGGGRVMVQPASPALQVSVAPGLAGVRLSCSTVPNGETPTAFGPEYAGAVDQCLEPYGARAGSDDPATDGGCASTSLRVGCGCAARTGGGSGIAGSLALVGALALAVLGRHRLRRAPTVASVSAPSVAGRR